MVIIINTNINTFWDRLKQSKDQKIKSFVESHNMTHQLDKQYYLLNREYIELQIPLLLEKLEENISKGFGYIEIHPGNKPFSYYEVSSQGDNVWFQRRWDILHKMIFGWFSGRGFVCDYAQIKTVIRISVV